MTVCTKEPSILCDVFWRGEQPEEKKQRRSFYFLSGSCVFAECQTVGLCKKSTFVKGPLSLSLLLSRSLSLFSLALSSPLSCEADSRAPGGIRLEALVYLLPGMPPLIRTCFCIRRQGSSGSHAAAEMDHRSPHPRTHSLGVGVRWEFHLTISTSTHNVGDLRAGRGIPARVAILFRSSRLVNLGRKVTFPIKEYLKLTYHNQKKSSEYPIF